ncbi:hypothetical protein Salat_2660600 [Sesamum alatum]|uniref:Uncharacterized protein n=1 Tax=Sesamum alatum TaxID=300844 RepID=A0AAE2CB09_9LAMI|nr:hypothetical protein Salat_2660600 [Sesamum alatum]
MPSITVVPYQQIWPTHQRKGNTESNLCLLLINNLLHQSRVLASCGNVDQLAYACPKTTITGGSQLEVHWSRQQRPPHVRTVSPDRIFHRHPLIKRSLASTMLRCANETRHPTVLARIWKEA